MLDPVPATISHQVRLDLLVKIQVRLLQKKKKKLMHFFGTNMGS